jgi:hypothetical protein
MSAMPDPIRPPPFDPPFRRRPPRRWPGAGQLARAALVLALVLPAGARAQPPPPPDSAPKTVYLNFSDGTESLTLGTIDDAAANVSSTGVAAPYPVFSWPGINTGAVTMAELVRRVVRRVHEVFLPYNVLVTTTRPAAGPYVMVMIGGHPRDIGVNLTVAGLAFMDCRNEVASDIVFAFPEMLRGNEQGLVVTIAQEAAHAFGLEHTNNRADIMYPTVVREQDRFVDEESPILDDRLCGNSTQNSHRRLLAAVGAWLGDAKPVDDGSRADRTPPTLTWLAPGPEATVAQPFTVRVHAEDEGGIDHVVLAADGDRGTLFRPPFAWSLAGFAPGPLAVTVIAYDAAGNTTPLSANVVVGGPPPGLPGGCALAGSGPAAAARAPLTTLPAVTLLGLCLLACIRRSRPL